MSFPRSSMMGQDSVQQHNAIILEFLFQHYTEGFLTPDSFPYTNLANWGSSWASKEAKFIKELIF